MKTAARVFLTGARVLLLAVALAAAPSVLAAGHYTQAWTLVSESDTPPPPEAGWQRVTLPAQWSLKAPRDARGGPWYRIEFERKQEEQAPWAAYLPYLSGGGVLHLNDSELLRIAQTDERLRIRWERPHLVPLPPALLRDGTNQLLLRPALADDPSPALRIPVFGIGPLAELQPLHERRLFWVRIMPQVTVAVCVIVSSLMLFIWWRRPNEVLYGMFGLAVGLWGIRTLTFVIEVLPWAEWRMWRLVYHSANGGFIVMMALFAARLARLHRPWQNWTLGGYWAIGPLLLLLSGGAAERLVYQYWTAGMIPVGLSVVALAGWAFGSRRDAESAILFGGVSIAVAAGIHDYLLAWTPGLLAAWSTEWTGHRLFLLHHGANLLLLSMGALLAARFVHTLSEVETLNRTLEERVAERETQLAANYARMGELERDRAAAEERQIIMQDLHDGLGSQLFTSLSRVERGDLDSPGIAHALRACIADMRLALEALAPEDQDFRTALGNFLFRWESVLREAGVQPRWRIELPDHPLPIAPHVTLQLLRVLQEALTNVLKHAQAKQVSVSLAHAHGQLSLCVEDDGRGLSDGTPFAGRGLANMEVRARRLGARLERQSRAGCTRIALSLPLGANDAPPPEPAPIRRLREQAPPRRFVRLGTHVVE